MPSPEEKAYVHSAHGEAWKQAKAWCEGQVPGIVFGLFCVIAIQAFATFGIPDEWSTLKKVVVFCLLLAAESVIATIALYVPAWIGVWKRRALALRAENSLLSDTLENRIARRLRRRVYTINGTQISAANFLLMVFRNYPMGICGSMLWRWEEERLGRKIGHMEAHDFVAHAAMSYIARFGIIDETIRTYHLDDGTEMPNTTFLALNALGKRVGLTLEDQATVENANDA